MEVNGFLLVDKPAGISTYDLIRRFKKETDFRGKIGHAGTLDPFATGLVILLIGKATKKFEEFQKYDKEYISESSLGESSDTLDIDGVVIEQQGGPDLDKAQLIEASKNFLGTINQAVPMYSAAKYKGKPLYKLAREGKTVSKTKSVEVKELEVIDVFKNIVKLRSVVTSGTYIRQLAYDLTRSLGIESVMTSLRRTRIGESRVSDAVKVEELKKENWTKFLITKK